MQRSKIFNSVAIAALLGSFAQASASSEECSSDAGEESDGTCALQFQKLGGQKFQMQKDLPHVLCNSTPLEYSYAGSGSNTMCQGNACCPQYGWTFACPSKSDNWDWQNQCTFGGFQAVPKQPLFNPQPGQLPPFADPEQPPRAPGSYGDVQLPTGQTLEEALKAVEPAIERVEVLREGQPGYIEGFNSSFLNPMSSDNYTITNTYPSIWGDLGPAMQPGMGGVKTFNVVNITIRSSASLKLFRLTTYRTKYDDRMRMCSLWWGFEPTFQTDLITAYQNLAVCNPYDAMVRCSVTGGITFTAIVGQGWALNKYGFMERGCTTPDGTNQVEKADNFAAQALVNQGFPAPSDSILQVIVPGCQMVAQTGGECKACKLPATREAKEQIPDLVAEFTKIAAESTPVQCRSDLREVRRAASPGSHFKVGAGVPAAPFYQSPGDMHR